MSILTRMRKCTSVKTCSYRVCQLPLRLMSKFLLKRGYVSVVSTTNMFQWHPLNSTRPSNCDFALLSRCHRVSAALTGQLADKPTRGHSSRRLNNSRTSQLADSDIKPNPNSNPIEYWQRINSVICPIYNTWSYYILQILNQTLGRVD